MTQTVVGENFKKEVIESTLPVVIDFFAQWCGPCIQMEPLFDELSKELADRCKFVKIDIEKDSDLAVEYNIFSVPTFVLIKDGAVAGKVNGYMNKDVLKAKIEDLLQ